MWTGKRPQTELPGTPRAQGFGSSIGAANTTPTIRPGSPTVGDIARLGAGLVVKGDISGGEFRCGRTRSSHLRRGRRQHSGQ